jgi:hypothetical protein
MGTTNRNFNVQKEFPQSLEPTSSIKEKELAQRYRSSYKISIKSYDKRI